MGGLTRRATAHGVGSIPLQTTSMSGERASWARLCRAMTPPTWFGRPLHTAVISSCVLPSDKARTCSPRVGEARLPPAGFAGVVRPRCRDRAAAFVAVVAVLAETAFFACRPLL